MDRLLYLQARGYVDPGYELGSFIFPHFHEPGCLKVGDAFVACVSPLSTVQAAFPAVSCLQVIK